ncbi:MAG: Uma2 family endonuclease [Rhodocyclaceae bacterium]|nr:Uma2 family endonuclease [Rhodocyclaceae bacterium]
MVDLLDAPVLRRFCLDRARYERMVEQGIFGPEDHLELLNGELIMMAPQKSRHATAVTLLAQALQAAFAGRATCRVQLPFNLDATSVPEPDIAVVPGSPRDYRDAHPERALLIVEVADATRAYDRGPKLEAYARAGVPEYWILDLATETLEVCREPFGDGFRRRQILSAAERVAPLAAPGREIAVADLLP